MGATLPSFRIYRDQHLVRHAVAEGDARVAGRQYHPTSVPAAEHFHLAADEQTQAGNMLL
jgi:hypothetical protein